MSGRIMITIPYHQDLTKPEGWTAYPRPGHKYFVARCHYMLTGGSQLPDAVRKGEVLDAYTSALGMAQTRTEAREVEYTELNFSQSVEEALREESSIMSFASTLSTHVGTDATGKISSDVRSEAKDALRSSFTNTFTVNTSETFRERKTLTLEYTIDPEKFDPTATVVAVQVYKKHHYDLYLAYVDYLVVEYKRSALGLVLKRHKFPEAGETKNHPNVIKFGIPLASLEFWKPLPNALIMDQRSYSIEVEDPSDVTVARLDRSMPFASFNPKQTLYQLAERAFRSRQLVLPF